jgi:hypothetical protein
MECSKAARRRRQMGRRGVNEDTNQNVDRNKQTRCAEKRPYEIHIVPSPQQTLGLICS